MKQQFYFKEHFPLPLTIEEIMGTWNRMASEIYINEIRLKRGRERIY